MGKSIICAAVCFCATFSFQSSFAQSCVDTAPIGDGWGWNGSDSCVVLKSDENVAASECVDTDGDGWGWNGTASCRAVAEIAANCIDIDGDGWGWTGSTSCRVTVETRNVPNQSNDVVQSGELPNGVGFKYSTLRREGHRGDNWCVTWASDDSQITSMDDGDWLNEQTTYHNMLYRIQGDSSGGATRSRVNGYPQFTRAGDGWFGYGVVSVAGTLYSMVSKSRGDAWTEGPFNGVKMLRSSDNGASWSRVDRDGNDRYLSPYDAARDNQSSDEMFFWKEGGRSNNGRVGYPFSFVSFVQDGQDNRAAKDGYVYVYSPEGSTSHELMLARVQAGQIGRRSSWQYFSGWDGSVPRWTSDINQRQANITLPDRNRQGEYFGWYSWLPSVVWNEGLQLYIMANGGTYAGTGRTNSTTDYYSQWMHEKSGSLGLWYSATPYGPWQQFYYTDHWTVDSAANRTYQPKLSPKWISHDGKSMVLIWSDAMRDANGHSHSVNYKWNQMEIEILTGK